jgi:DNA repair exonuclease SbcCD ATPase subunit
MERAESRGRNYRYDALRVKQRIDSINAVLGKSTPVSKTAAELEANYEALLAERNAALDESLEAEALAADADVQFAGASATLLSLRRDYAQTFSKHVGDRSITARHPIVLEATENLRCGICGSQGDSVAESVRAQLAINACPLCDNPLDNTRGKTANLERLKELDIRIGTAKSQLESTGSKRERLALSLAEVRQRVASCTARVREFEIQHSEAAKRVQGRAAAATAPQDELDRLTREFETLLNESKQAYAERDTWKTKLQAIQKKLEQHYQNAEKDFVPLFRTLAEQFLGIDLDIVVERQGAIGITLVLEMRQTKRRLQYQLSESQRFFLDIALRMALATFVSDKHSKAALFVDTPEGSLDIAYESRAGAMFASFAKSGHDILMTANINTSELLRKLASECGDQRMTLVRMTEWTDLSNVQLQESPLFERAYGEIEKELHTHAE